MKFDDNVNAKETLEKIQDEFPLDNRFCLLQYDLEKNNEKNNEEKNEYKIVTHILPVNISLIEVM